MSLQMKFTALILVLLFVGSTGAVAVSAQNVNTGSATPTTSAESAAPAVNAGVTKEVASGGLSIQLAATSPIVINKNPGANFGGYFTGQIPTGGRGTDYSISGYSLEWMCGNTWTYGAYGSRYDNFPLNADGTFKLGIYPDPSYFCSSSPQQYTIQFHCMARIVPYDGSAPYFIYSNPVTVTFVNGAGTTPVASLRAVPNIYRLGDPVGVTLDGSLSRDPNSEKLTYLWTLTQKPAGSAAKLVTSDWSNIGVLHPDKPGTYKVTLVVKNSDNVKSTPTTVTVTAYELSAAFKITPDQPYVRDLITFDASQSTGAITNYHWAFDDGSKPVDSTKPVVYHAFTKPDTYHVALTVTNSAGLKATTTKTIVVGDKWAIIVAPKLASDALAGKDAQSVHDFLVGSCHFADDKIHVKMLTGHVDSADVNSEIISLAMKTSSHDLVVFYVSDHGTSPGNYWFATDDGHVSDIQLAEWFWHVNSRNTVFILDTCYSGAALTGPLVNGRYAKPNYVILAACRYDELSNAKNLIWLGPLHVASGGIFTQFLLYELKNPASDTHLPRDGWVSFEEAFWRAAWDTKEYTKDYPKVEERQLPMIYDLAPGKDIDVYKLPA